MPDLARLRNIITSGNENLPFAAAALYHLSPRPHVSPSFDAEAARDSLAWLSAAPRVFYGDVLGGAGFLPEDFAAILAEASDDDLVSIATLANSMHTPDERWDRSTRNHFSSVTTVHGKGAAMLQAQSAAEFAALDSLLSLGYGGLLDAQSAMNVIRNKFPSATFNYVTRQFCRSRICLAVRIVDRGRVHAMVTPWCLSRHTCHAYMAAVFSRFQRDVVEISAAACGKTIWSVTARYGYEAVRNLTEPAAVILTRYTYDKEKLAFVDALGDVVQTIATRSPPVFVALAAVHFSGKGDVLSQLARDRKELVLGVPNQVETPSSIDYFERTECLRTGLLLYLRLLDAYRWARDRGWYACDRDPNGSELNKGPMLGYVARGRTTMERNTASCVNRINEVAALLRHHDYDMSTLLFVLEWGGPLNHAAVMAAVALAGLDVALDVAYSGVDVPGSEVEVESDIVYSYHLYLSSAKRRRLARLPIIEYGNGSPIMDKLEKLYDTLGGNKSGYSFVSVTGGVTEMKVYPNRLIDDAHARRMSMNIAKERVPVIYYTMEVLFPRMCLHGVNCTTDDCLSTTARLVSGCSECESMGRAIDIVSDIVAEPGMRMVKTRSSYGHNENFSLEWFAPFGDELETTLETLDAAVGMNIMRNHKWPSAPVFGNRDAMPVNTELEELLKPATDAAYKTLATLYVGPMSDEAANSVAASIS